MKGVSQKVGESVSGKEQLSNHQPCGRIAIKKQQLDGTQRVVVCAANRSKTTGKIVCGARHWDERMREWAFEGNERKADWLSAEQGFIDQFGVWMNRQEAWTVAEAAGQIKYGPITAKGTLYSEDLY